MGHEKINLLVVLKIKFMYLEITSVFFSYGFSFNI